MSQFLSENSNSLIVGSSIKFWSKIYNILGYMKKSIFSKFGVYFRWKMWKTVNRNFLKKNRKNPFFLRKSMSYNFVLLYIKDFLWNFIFETFDNKKNNIFHEKCKKQSILTFLKKIAKIQFFEENQCRTMLYYCVSRISWLNFIFETLDNKKNNQKMDQKIKRRS